MRQDNQYAAFLADFSAGRLSDGEMLAAGLHFALSEDGARSLSVIEAAGGALIEGGRTAAIEAGPRHVERQAEPDVAPDDQFDWVGYYSGADLMNEAWRTSLLGVKTRATHLRTASLLRLDPGRKAPRHNHGTPDVTVVLRGAFADDWGEYQLGDLAFAGAGERHAPEVIGDETCICLVATPEGRPTVDVRGWLGGLFNPGSRS